MGSRYISSDERGGEQNLIGSYIQIAMKSVSYSTGKFSPGVFEPIVEAIIRVPVKRLGQAYLKGYLGPNYNYKGNNKEYKEIKYQTFHGIYQINHWFDLP